MIDLTQRIYQRVGTHKTQVIRDGITTQVVYHVTPVVTFDTHNIVLNTGGWHTATTKLRMNQASRQYRLGYTVYQKEYEWYADYQYTWNGNIYIETFPFNDGKLKLARVENHRMSWN